jgi:hypothetical protein
LFYLKYEKFRNLIIQSVFSTPDISRPVGETSDDDIVGSWRKIINQRTQLFEKIDNLKDQNESLKASLKASESTSTQNLQFINNFENDILGIEVQLIFNTNLLFVYILIFLKIICFQTRLSLSSRKVETIQNEIALLKEKNSSNPGNLSGLTNCIISIYKNEIAFLKEMEDLLKASLKIEIKPGECKN